MNSMFRFWKELRRRNLPKSIISYIVFSWATLQIIDVLSSFSLFPKSVGKIVFIILLAFLPLWTIFSWFYNITPDGIEKTAKKEGDIDENTTEKVGKRLNIFIVVFLSLAVILLIVDRTRLTSQQNESSQEIIETEIENSIAVLPFKDISAQQNQGYFADGLAEELINTLSKISDIKVTSRTSAFLFKNNETDIPTIAKKLNVNYILEGSVRSQDSMLRVGIQLIDTQKDSYAWSQTWDKKLENIFQIQNEISTIVAQRLELKITGREIPQATKVDPKAYELYLKAKYEMNLPGGTQPILKAKELLLDVIKIDSTYAPAWEFLSKVYHQLNNYGIISKSAGYPLAKNAALKALGIDSTYTPAYAILATIAIDYERDYEKANDIINTGLLIEPNNPEVLNVAAEVALLFMDYDKALQYHLKLVALDPLDDGAYYALGSTYYFMKQYEKAEEAFRRSLQLYSKSELTHHLLSVSLLFQNKLDEALEVANKETNEAFKWHTLAMVYYKMDNIKESNHYLNLLIDNHQENYSFQIACTYGFLQDKDKAFYWLDKAILYQDFGLMESQIDPALAECRKDKRWPEFRSKLGFLDEVE